MGLVIVKMLVEEKLMGTIIVKNYKNGVQFKLEINQDNFKIKTGEI